MSTSTSAKQPAEGEGVLLAVVGVLGGNMDAVLQGVEGGHGQVGQGDEGLPRPVHNLPLPDVQARCVGEQLGGVGEELLPELLPTFLMALPVT